MTSESSSETTLTEHEKELLKTFAGFLTQEEYRFQYLADDCLELYLQGKNLTMRMLIYLHNRHVVVRVPAFLRNVDLRRPDILSLLLELMNGFFDIRFELSDDGQSLSGSANHILEDGTMTKNQFMQCVTVVAFMVDDAYPKLMKLIYAGGDPPKTPSGKSGSGEKPDGEEKSGSSRKREDKVFTGNDKIKIN